MAAFCFTLRYGEGNWLPIIPVHAGFHNVPLEPPNQQCWQAAVGYAELGMFQDANDELEKIDLFNRALPEILAVRIAIYQGLKKWELMQQVAKRLKQFAPG